MDLIKKIGRSLSFLRDCERGVAYMEFAFSVTLLLVMFFGAVEISRYILMVQKVEKTIDTLTDVFTQVATTCITNSQVTDYLNATSELMSPYAVGNQGTVYFSDVKIDDSGNATLNWQVQGGGTLSIGSAVDSSSVQGTPVTLPPNFTTVLNHSEEMVIGEMYYIVNPILLQNVVAPTQIYRVAVFTLRSAPTINPPQASCP